MFNINIFRPVSTLFKATAIAASLLISGSLFAMDGAAREGELKGLNRHDVSGTVELVKEGDGYVINFSDDFVFDGAPDPKVALGKDGKYDSGTLIRLLDSNKGAQSYKLPANLNPNDYNEIYIWCEKFAVGLAVASIK